MIRLTPAQLVTAIGMIVFLLVQLVILELRDAGVERAKLSRRLAAVQSELAAFQERFELLNHRFDRLSDFTINELLPPLRKHSEDTPPPEEL